MAQISASLQTHCQVPDGFGQGNNSDAVQQRHLFIRHQKVATVTVLLYHNKRIVKELVHDPQPLLNDVATCGKPQLACNMMTFVEPFKVVLAMQIS